MMKKIFLPLVFIFLCSGAFAQQDSTRVLHDVVISATKFPTSIKGTAKVITVISLDSLPPSTSLSQVLNQQAGLFVSGANSNPGKDKSLYLNGASAKYTLIMIDGVPLYDPSGVGGTFDLRLLPLDQFSRIEILKGAQSVLYGTDAIAGVINLISKNPSNKNISVRAQAMSGSFGTFQPAASVSGKIEKATYAAGWSRYQTRGISEAYDAIGNNNFDKDGLFNNTGYAQAGYSITPHLSITGYGRMSFFQGRYDAGAFQDAPIDTYRQLATQYGTQVRYQRNKFSMQAMLSQTNSSRQFDDSYGTYKYNGVYRHGELVFQQSLSPAWQLSGGVSVQFMKMKTDVPSVGNPSYVLFNPYLFLRYTNKKWMNDMGVRLNESAFGKALTYSINPSVLLTNTVRLFGSLATGFKAPTLSDMYGQWGANPNLKPEKSMQWEGGLRHDEATWSGSVYYFNRTIRNGIVSVNSKLINQDKQHDEGVEGNFSFSVTNRFRAQIFYTYLTGQVTTQTATGGERTYNNLYRRPKNSVGCQLQYQPTKKINVQLNAKTFGTRHDIFYKPDFTSEEVRMSPYALIDAQVTYTLPHVKIFIAGKNLLNQNYWEAYGYSVMPINAQAGVQVNW